MPKPNRFYIPGEGRAAGVHDLFAVIADRYDLVNDLQSLGLHRLWKRGMIRRAKVREGEDTLDLCCGTGDIAFRLAAAGARVTAIDFSEAMLTVARERGRKGGPKAASVRFEQGDALALPVGEEAFELVTMAYGLRNLRDIDEGLAEMARVTRPGGRALILDFGKPTRRWWRQLYFLHLRTVVPLLGRIFCGQSEAHAYILESLRRYPDAPTIAERMRVAGWTDVTWWNHLGGVMTLHRGRRPANRCDDPMHEL